MNTAQLPKHLPSNKYRIVTVRNIKWVQFTKDGGKTWVTVSRVQ